MSCNTLVLVDEVFGPPIAPSVVEGTLARGEWLGLTLAVEQGGGGGTVPIPTATYDINGTSVTLTRDPSGNTVTAMVREGGTMFTLSLPWRSPAPGITALAAAKFRTGADFLVIRDADSALGAADWRLWVFDLRGGSVAAPVLHGPYTLPSTQTLNISPNASGQLLLLWHGHGAGLVTGRTAWVQRTELPASQVPSVAHVNDISASGTLGAQIDASARTVTVFDNALRNGNVSVSRTALSRNLISDSLPPSGRCSLSPQSLTLSDGQSAASFTLTNTGGDFLSLDGVSVDMPLLATVSVLAGGPCLSPNQTATIGVQRVGAAGGNATVTVATTPAAAPPSSGRVAVTIRAAVVTPPRPALAVSPLALEWRVGALDQRTLRITNVGNVSVDVQVAPPSAGSGFAWAPVPKTALAVGTSLLPPVAVRPLPTGPDAGTLTVEAFEAGTGTALQGFPRALPLAKNKQAKVLVGNLRITALLADAPGDDMAVEGEFIEIANITSQPLDLTGCSITHELRTSPAATPPQRVLTNFGANAFGNNAILEPLATAGRSLRVLTRAKQAGEPSDPLRFYAASRAAVWNNAGDTARVKNEFGDVVDTYAYVPQRAAGGGVPPGTHVVQPPARQRVATRRVFVNATHDWTTVFPVQDGDLLTVRNVTGTVTLGGFLGAAGSSGPAGRGGSAAGTGFPLPGAPLYALIGVLGKLEVDGSVTPEGMPFFIGSGGVVTVALDKAGLTFFLGVNDDVLWDNGGEFDAAIDLYR